MQKDEHCKACSLCNSTQFSGPEGNMENPSIVVIDSFPWEVSKRANTTYTSRNRDILKSMFETQLKALSFRNKPTVAYCYSIQCVPPRDQGGVKNKFKTDVSMINACAVKVMQWIDHVKPKVIFAAGAAACKTLGIKENVHTIRGSVQKLSIGYTGEVTVIPTYSMGEIATNPGLTQTFITDINKAISYAQEYRDAAPVDIQVIKDADEIVAKLKELVGKAEEVEKQTGRKMWLAVDTETTSLQPYNMNDRIIAVSLSASVNSGMSFPFEHSGNMFNEEQLSAIKDNLGFLLSSPSVRLVFANNKFDVQWLRHHYKIPMKDPEMDVILAEHTCSEDKAGEYSLKDITRDRFPSMGNYEFELHRKLQDKQLEFDTEFKQRVTDYKQRVKDTMVSWWVSLEQSEREKYLSDWVSKGFVDLNDSTKLVKVKYVTRCKEKVIPKTYSAAIAKMINSVPMEYVQGLVLPEETLPDKARKVTFEDVDIDTMLWYAAVDAMTTLIIAQAQFKDFIADKAIIDRVSKAEQALGNPPLQTVAIGKPFKEITMPLSQALADMEYNGVRFDRERCASYITILEEKMAEYKDAMYQDRGVKFSLSSSAPDLGNILFTDMGLTPIKYTESGAPSTDADSLKQLCDQHDLPFLKKLLDYRRMDKCLNTYLKNWLKMSELDGRIHCSFNQIGTATYRLSSSNPL